MSFISSTHCSRSGCLSPPDSSSSFSSSDSTLPSSSSPLSSFSSSFSSNSSSSSISSAFIVSIHGSLVTTLSHTSSSLVLWSLSPMYGGDNGDWSEVLCRLFGSSIAVEELVRLKVLSGLSIDRTLRFEQLQIT
ncbi:hypothetical protein LguiA_003836 [Lonicera macranthoides]